MSWLDGTDDSAGWTYLFGEDADRAPDSPSKLVLRDRGLTWFWFIPIMVVVPWLVAFAMHSSVTYAILRDYEMACGIPVTVILLLAQVAASNYWLEFDDHVLRIHWLLGTRVIDLRAIAQIIATQSSKDGVAAEFFGQDGKCVLKLTENAGPPTQVFGEIMRRTRSDQVALYKRDLRRNWYKRVNLRNSPWQPCDKPDNYRSAQWKDFQTLLVVVSMTIGVVYVVMRLVYGDSWTPL